MNTKLHTFPFMKRGILERLSQYGYESAEEFLSTCRVENGVKSLAGAMECTEEQVRDLEERIKLFLGRDASPEPFEPPPMGAILDKKEDKGVTNE